MSTCNYKAKLACTCVMKSVNQFIRLERRTWWNWRRVNAVLMQHPAHRTLISAIDPLSGGWNTEYPRAIMGVQTHWLLGYNNLHLRLCWTSIPLHWQHRLGGEGIALMDETGTKWEGTAGRNGVCICICADKLVLRIASNTKLYQFTKGQLIKLQYRYSIRLFIRCYV